MRVYERVHKLRRGSLSIRVWAKSEESSGNSEVVFQRQQIETAISRAPRASEAVADAIAALSFCRAVEVTPDGDAGLLIYPERS